MILFRKFTLPFLVITVAALVGVTFFHNGFYEQCPFCRSGKADVEKMRGETDTIARVGRVIYSPMTEQSGITAFNMPEDLESRAPPV